MFQTVAKNLKAGGGVKELGRILAKLQRRGNGGSVILIISSKNKIILFPLAIKLYFSN